MSLILQKKPRNLIHSNIDWIEANSITSEKICSCSQPILLHEGYMTAYLQKSRHITLHIKRLWQNHHPNFLERSTFLLDQEERCHVIAKIKIFLPTFSLNVRRKIIESHIPLGEILNQTNIQPTFKERRYFTLPEISFLDQITPYRKCCAYFFGRSHTIVTTEGKLLAEVYEVLP